MRADADNCKADHGKYTRGERALFSVLCTRNYLVIVQQAWAYDTRKAWDPIKWKGPRDDHVIASVPLGQ